MFVNTASCLKVFLYPLVGLSFLCATPCFQGNYFLYQLRLFLYLCAATTSLSTKQAFLLPLSSAQVSFLRTAILFFLANIFLHPLPEYFVTRRKRDGPLTRSHISIKFACHFGHPMIFLYTPYMLKLLILLTIRGLAICAS